MPKTQTKTKPSKKTAARTQPKKTQAAKSGTKKAAAKSVNAKSVKKTPKKTAAKKAANPKPRFDKKFLDSQLKILKEERKRYMTSAEQAEREAEDLLQDREATDIQVAEESGEGDTTSQYRELDLTISAQSREVVEEIDQAIVRIKKGTYGICVDTGKPIPKKRLEAIPWASQTIEAKAGGLRRY